MLRWRVESALVNKTFINRKTTRANQDQPIF
jgi:hypothetical protein